MTGVQTCALPISDSYDVDADVAAFKCDQFLFVFVGTLSRRKGVDVLLNAFKLLGLNDTESRLALIGPEHYSCNCRAHASRLGMDTRILFRGPLRADKVHTAINLADVVILPSRSDGWGMALNEAASAGKALISTSECGSAWHLIRDGENGFRIGARDAETLAGRMLAYARDSALAKRHGDASRRIFAEYTPEKNVERLTSIITGLLPKGREATQL